MKRLLPIGSIVITDLEKNEKIMIIGRVVKQNEEDQKYYDYCGCIAPIGIQNQESFKMFNHEEIRRLLFIGYQDEEELNFSVYAKNEKDKLNKEQ